MLESPQSPFSALDPRLREAVERRGFRQPTEIQRLALPALLANGDDALLVAPTGTGKTEAALLPLLSARLANPSPAVSVLYVTPLRALNRDLEHRLVSLAREIGLTAAVRHGDTPTAARQRQSRTPPDLLLTTPETLQLLLVGARLRESLRGVRTVVVDELHELAPSDRGAQLSLSLERLDAFAGRPVRRIGLSATIGNPDEVARFLSPPPRTVRAIVAEQFRRVHLIVRAPAAETSRVPDALRAELKVDPVQLAALVALEDEVRAHRTTLVFVNTRPTAEGLAARLTRLAPDLPVAVHHGSLSREVREEAERQFREGQLRCLVATSSLELGIDVGGVDLVVQYGSPHQTGRLVQRIGRSGHRLDEEIRGVLLGLDDEDLEEGAVLARRALARELEPTRWRTRNRLAIAQQVVASLRAEKEVVGADLRKVFIRSPVAQDLTLPEWYELFRYLEELGSLKVHEGRVRAGRGTLHRFYSTLSLIPDQKTYRLRDIATRRVIGTLDERFVVTQILSEPELIFLLRGRTWKVVEFREDELLVEAVQELGQEPRWVGEDLPVPFEAAQEIGRLRRTGALEGYPLAAVARERLEARFRRDAATPARPDDRTITVTVQGRIVLFGACFGTRTNDALATILAGVLTARLGGRVEVLATEPTWIVLGLPIAVDGPTLAQLWHQPPETVDTLLEKLLPGGLEYRYVFLTVARKFGVVPVSADARNLRDLEPLMERSRTTPLGEETLEKTLFDRFDAVHAREVMQRLRDGEIRVEVTPPSEWTDLPLRSLRWRDLPDVPPPTLLKAVEERLRQEPLTLVCLRCGFFRTTTPARYREEGGNRCRICHGALSAVLSPRRPEDVDALVKYARKKWKKKGAARAPPASIAPLVRSAYTSAELVAHYGERALLAFAGRGIGPDTARRMLSRLYRSDVELITEILRAERNYARTRAFWD